MTRASELSERQLATSPWHPRGSGPLKVGGRIGRGSNDRSARFFVKAGLGLRF